MHVRGQRSKLCQIWCESQAQQAWSASAYVHLYVCANLCMPMVLSALCTMHTPSPVASMLQCASQHHWRLTFVCTLLLTLTPPPGM
jgi:hypothetical protein